MRTILCLLIVTCWHTMVMAQGSSVVPEPGICRTLILPETPECAAIGGNCGASLRIPPEGFRPVEYHPPVGVTRVGLEFWFHQFSGASPAGSQQILVYLNEPGRWSRRMFHAWNGDPTDQGVPKYMAMSTFLHPEHGEWLTVGWLNSTTQWQDGFLAITIRECW